MGVVLRKTVRIFLHLAQSPLVSRIGGRRARLLLRREDPVAVMRLDERPLEEGLVEAANRAVAELGVGAATTLAVVEIQGRSVRTYHVGDSMILAVGQRGKVRFQATHVR